MTALAAPSAEFDWNDLRFLIALAESGSTIAAARRLHVNQSTVAGRITALEQALGVAFSNALWPARRLHHLPGDGKGSRPLLLEPDVWIGKVSTNASEPDLKLIGRVQQVVILFGCKAERRPQWPGPNSPDANMPEWAASMQAI